MNNYHNGKIYKIISNLTDMLYVGSCYTSLSKRLYAHKQKGNNCSSKMIIEFGEYNIILIEDYKCENKRELEKREQYWIDFIKNEGGNVINKKSAYRTEKQRIEYHKQYDLNHVKDRKITDRLRYQEKKCAINTIAFLSSIQAY